MANESSARVYITVDHRVRDALAAFIEAINANEDAYYVLLGPEYEVDSEGESTTFSGYVNGRWAYATNLEGYLLEGDHGIPDWVKRGAPEEEAWSKLRAVLIASASSISIEYVDVESGGQFLFEGLASLECKGGTAVFEHDGKHHEFTIENLMTVADYGLDYAITSTYGMEVEELFEDTQVELRAAGQPNVLEVEMARCQLRDKLLASWSLEEAEAISQDLFRWLEGNH